MTAHLDLGGRGEPSEVVVAFAQSGEEGRFRVVHFHRDLLAKIVWHRRIQNADSRWIAAERTICESVDDVDGLRHQIILSQLSCGQGLQLPLLGDQLTQILFTNFLLGVSHFEEIIVELLEAVCVEVEAHFVEPVL